MHSAVRRNTLCSKEKWFLRRLHNSKEKRNLSLKDSAHHIPNQTEIATEKFCPKSLLQNQNEIDFIESHFQILHHLKIVQKRFLSHAQQNV